MKFDIGTILSVTHGKLLTSMDNIYAILNYMLDDSLFTHQLPRASQFCKEFILAEHPQLKKWDNYSQYVNTETWEEYLGKAKRMFGSKLEISKVPANSWEHKDPLEELQKW